MVVAFATLRAVTLHPAAAPLGQSTVRVLLFVLG